MLTYFTNPYLLWGTLAVAIPILIHFWHQKRGTVMPWAVTQWLTEKNQQQQRGVKFDNLWLMLLRALLVVLLAVLLSEPIVNWFGTTRTVQTIHLVQPDALLVDNFRFELENALKKGEPLYWANAATEPITTLALPQQPEKFSALGLQADINRLQRPGTQLNLYVLNTERLADVPFIYVPAQFRLHTIADSSRSRRNFLVTPQTKLFVNGSGRLATGTELPSTVRFASASAHDGALAVLLRLRDKTERQTARAALDALTDVYKLDLATDEQSLPGKHYDVILADQLPANPSPKTLYIISGVEQPSAVAGNIIPIRDSFRPQSDLVTGGQLPEWLGEHLVTYFGLNPTQHPLSQQQLNALFVPARRPAAKRTTDESSAAIHGGLLLTFIVLIGAERWLALTKNA